VSSEISLPGGRLFPSMEQHSYPKPYRKYGKDKRIDVELTFVFSQKSAVPSGDPRSKERHNREHA
jgi:hypothetical protein